MGWSFMSVAVYLVTFLIVFWSEFSLVHVSELGHVQDHLGTRTPYRFKQNVQDDKVEYPGCQQRKVWGLLRHGTRLPSDDEITKMKEILPVLAQQIVNNQQNGKGDLVDEQIELFKVWSTSLDESEDNLLAKEGEEELLLLGERLKKRFPDAISDSYNNESFSFRYTNTERAEKSARYFSIGLFDEETADDVWYPSPLSVEELTRFYKYCDRWQEEVKNNDATFEQQNIYEQGQEIATALQRISERLGLNETISFENANLIYRVCGYETSWTKDHLSPWCFALDQSDAEKFEYYDDLKHYWQDGYGFDLTHDQACVMIKDMFDTFSEDNWPQSSFVFSHSGTMLKTLAHLGLYRPASPLTAAARQPDREWTATDIDCFASNLFFVLYSCEDGDYVLPLHQERPVTLAPCSEPLCPLALLREHFTRTIHQCNFQEMCSLDDNAL